MHPGSADTLRALIDIERERCAWITFALFGPSVEMTAPEGRRSDHPRDVDDGVKGAV